MDSSSVYSGIVSARSRRLRTIGLVLLLAVCAMALYGYFGLMPSIERSLRDNPVPPGSISSAPRTARPPVESAPPSRAERVRKLQVAVALAYWGVCSLLLIGVVVVAWLDFREVTRSYAAQRRAMWTEAVGTVQRDRSDDD